LFLFQAVQTCATAPKKEASRTRSKNELRKQIHSLATVSRKLRCAPLSAEILSLFFSFSYNLLYFNATRSATEREHTLCLKRTLNGALLKVKFNNEAKQK